MATDPTRWDCLPFFPITGCPAASKTMRGFLIFATHPISSKTFSAVIHLTAHCRNSELSSKRRPLDVVGKPSGLVGKQDEKGKEAKRRRRYSWVSNCPSGMVARPLVAAVVQDVGLDMMTHRPSAGDATMVNANARHPCSSR